MRHLGAVIGAGVLMVLAAGCAQQRVATGSAGGLSTSSPPSSASGVTGPAMPGLHLPAGAEPVPGTQVDASALSVDFPRQVWTENGGTTLGLDGEQGACMTSKATVTGQTDTEVVIQLDQQRTGSGGHACPLYLRYQPLSVHLDSPLGHRTVVLRLVKG